MRRKNRKHTSPKHRHNPCTHPAMCSVEHCYNTWKRRKSQGDKYLMCNDCVNVIRGEFIYLSL